MAILRAEGKSLREIARVIGRSHSTILREFKKHISEQTNHWYLPFQADLKAYSQRHQRKRRGWLKSPEVRFYVEEKISLGWSPEQVSGRISRDLPPSRLVMKLSIGMFIDGHGI